MRPPKLFFDAKNNRCPKCVSQRFDRELINAFRLTADRQEIDLTFVEFAAFCRREDLALTVVSDGMDYYIARILRRFGIGDLPVVANTLELVPAPGRKNVRLAPQFPNRDEMCDRCASCKRNHIITSSADDDVIVFVGEGYSDRCPARYADVVFAKDELMTYCREENISYYEYRSFSDVTGRLANMLRRRGPDGAPSGFRKRRQAELARRDIFIGG